MEGETMVNEPPIDPWRFDALVDSPKIIWGADAIARRLRVSADFVRDRLAKLPGTPIMKKAGRYCVVESDLVAWFRTTAVS
jgi:hypothetical protein